MMELEVMAGIWGTEGVVGVETTGLVMVHPPGQWVMVRVVGSVTV